MLNQRLQQKLLQKLSPQQIQFIKLLQLSTVDLEQRIEQELMDNPALESSKDGVVDEVPNPEYNEYEDNDKEAEDFDDDPFAEENLFDISDYTSDDDDSFHLYEEGGSDEEKKELPFAVSSSFREQLVEQISGITEDETEFLLANQIIGSIEEDGYLRRPLASIVNDLAFSQNIETTTDELERILHKVQGLDPPGIGARSLQECLLLQLYRKDKIAHPETDLAIKIIQDHMDDFTKKHYEKLIRQLKIDEEELRDAIHLITRLNPKPGESTSEEKVQYIVPDFLVVETDNGLEVQLNSRNAPELKISRSYMDTLKTYEKSKDPDKKLKDTVQFIKQKLDGAKWFIDSIKQRQNTLLTTMSAIVHFQEEYFKTGDETKLRPMILKDIADRVGLDVSTISRVANSKYVQTDFGIISLKFFFSEGISTEDGEEVSNKEVKKILKDAIEAEDKSRPLPDEKLMEILKDKGYNIARRTVAKYREQMNIPVARLRKQI